MMDSHAREDRREGKRAAEAESFRSRVARQKRAIARISEFLDAHEPKPGSSRQRQSNETDNNRAKLKGSHGTVRGYNALAMVDARHQVIVAAEPVASVHEGEHLELMLDQTESNARAAGMGDAALEGVKMLADTAYYSEGNVKLCDERRIDVYLPDPQFRRRDPRFAPKNRRRLQKGLCGLQEFRFDARRKVYRCPNGKELKLNAAAHRVKRFEGRRYTAALRDCQDCRVSNRCLKAGSTRRQLYIVDRTVERDWLQEMRQEIDSTRGRAQYARRMGIVEPVFGNITVLKGMDRFTLRGQREGACAVADVRHGPQHRVDRTLR
jgi:hypothetical protein